MIHWIVQSIVVVVLRLIYCECFEFEDCLSRSGCSVIIHDLVFGEVVCCVEAEYNGISDVPGLAQLTLVTWLT
jgi:hypothetical protein